MQKLLGIIVAEGKGIEEDPVREVYYIYTPEGQQIGKMDPCECNCKGKKA